MYMGPSCVLEDYYYVIKEHARRNFTEIPRTIRFTGRKISEFKLEIFNKNIVLKKHDANLTEKDLEVLYNGEVLDNDYEIEYCFTHVQNPLIIYVPTDLTQEEYREYTKIAINNLESYKCFGGSVLAEMNSLQMDIEEILDMHAQQYQIEMRGKAPSSGKLPDVIQIPPPSNFANMQSMNQQHMQQHQQQCSVPLSQVSTVSSQHSNYHRSNSTPQMMQYDSALPPHINQQIILLNQVMNSQSNQAYSQPSSKSSQFTYNYEKITYRSKALKKINVKPLLDRIDDLVNMFGGPQLAFDMEWKIRIFIVEILNFALIQRPLNKDSQQQQQQNQMVQSNFQSKSKNQRSTSSKQQQQQQLQQQSQYSSNGLRLDGEKGIEQFGQKVQPDLTVSSHDGLQMLYIIEIKNFKTIKGKGILKTAISENFKQLRNFCLQRKKLEMTGISTNFGMWIFTKYSKKDEMLNKKTPFMVSEPIEIMDINENKVREEELQKLILILDWLCHINKCS